MSVYGQIHRDAWGTALPICWDKVQSMFKYLNSMSWSYQLIFETRLISHPLHPSIRCTLIRWEETKTERERNVLLQTDDGEQMEAALLMLINEAEQHLQQKPSMIP